MVGALLFRGMLAGLLAGFLAAGFAAFAGEPPLERAIAFESASAAAAGEAPEPEIVSRQTQRSFGLLTAGAAYGAAIGGFFSLAFAFAYGRMGVLDPRAASLLLAGLGFVAVALVPELKYPANPPAIGAPETVGARTTLFFEMSLISVLAMISAAIAGGTLSRWFGAWSGWLIRAVLFVAAVGLAAYLLPSINEIPAGFPADVLWNFRIAALGAQAVLWSALGLCFGLMLEGWRAELAS